MHVRRVSYPESYFLRPLVHHGKSGFRIEAQVHMYGDRTPGPWASMVPPARFADKATAIRAARLLARHWRANRGVFLNVCRDNWWRG